ncbi:phasin family protein [Alkalihalobacillus pseudalcaliphilus]|uniref:phasin family protein n=1 Tax=Alkalihalobacillus pseudalcaliphilus TaxID=79884 RepID=UPI00064D9BA4|nr:ATP synthase subunit B [Alkalihalobacillus pseudalcaliphilus]KMK76841.1 ATP synthase subunit B [Alkalihalobacillus pseudalcaliphilus]
MRDAIKKGMALGFGLAAASKEQAEKVFDDLVKKGELTRKESQEFMDHVMAKGTEKQEQFDSKMMEQMKKLLREWDVATKDDVQALEERVKKLEQEIYTK